VKKPPNPNRKVKITLAFSAKLIDRMRDVVYWAPTLTLAGLAESAIESKLKKILKGKRVRARRGRIRLGRPRKAART
jgi:hypothetical protein